MESEIPREAQETLSSAKNVSASLPFPAAAAVAVAKARILCALRRRELLRAEKDEVGSDTTNCEKILG